MTENTNSETNKAPEIKPQAVVVERAIVSGAAASGRLDDEVPPVVIPAAEEKKPSEPEPVTGEAPEAKEKPSETEPVTEDAPEAQVEKSQETASNRRVEIIGIRFKSAGKVYYFDPSGITLSVGDNVMVETARGVEFGTVAIANRIIQTGEVVTPLKKVLRSATSDDLAKRAKAALTEDKAKKVWNELITSSKLEMDLVDVECSFDGSKLLFYFTADGRVDFRGFVKELAGVFKTRIELRQIGVRDEAKQIGGLGVCGRPFCCSTFLDDFQQVSIKMAKEQGLSLNSAKISGTCGRLMCCLRYENDVYEEESRKTPKVDSIVETPKGNGIVVENNVLAGLVKVIFPELDNASPEIMHRDDVKVIGNRKSRQKRDSEEKTPKKPEKK